jgi:hypothetical protein
MVGRRVIISAIVVYLTVALGCVLNAPGESAPDSTRPVETGSRAGSLAPTAHLAELPLRGVGMQIHRVDWMDEYKKSMDEIAKLGADSVLLVVNARMENGSSSLIYVDVRLTPTPAQLGDLIDHAKRLKLKVVLMPTVLLDKPRGMEWRGTINPDDWAAWWESYRSFLYHYCWVAQAHKVDVLVVGSELVSTETKVDEWRKTISMVRQQFTGMLTYSANWDHYKDIPFWDRLDLIGLNSYYKLGSDERVTVAEIQKNWAPIQQKLLEFVHKTRKPLLFLEVGWCNLRNAASEPWDYTQESEPIDLDLQRRLYEGFFRSWYGVKELGGFMIWEWPPGDGGLQNRGYTPEGKPAEKVLKEWFAKPRWKVE